jgi:hypothetical protein
MKVDLTLEQCVNYAILEKGSEISAGMIPKERSIEISNAMVEALQNTDYTKETLTEA